MIRKFLLLTLGVLLVAVAIKGAEWFSGRVTLPDSTVIEQAPGFKGWVDGASVKGDKVTLQGWAVDVRSKTPAEKVEIFGNGKKLATVKPTIARRDVAEQLHLPKLGPAGFQTTIDTKGIAPPKGIEFRVFGIMPNGQGEELNYTPGLAVHTALVGKNLEHDVSHFLAWLTDSLVPIFNVMRNPNAAVGLSVAMVAVGLFLLAWLIIAVMLPVFRDLARATARVRRLPDAPAFAENFADIDGLLSGTRYVAHGWRIFQGLLVRPGPATGATILTRHRASAFINLAEAEAAGLSFRFWQALPSYFVGFGLIFTFLGLVASIYFASQGVFANSLRETQLDLGNLLAAATFKFLTSITGLGMSLVISIVYRLLMVRLQRAFDRLCAEIESRMTIVADLPASAPAVVPAPAPAASPIDAAELGAALSGAVQPLIAAIQTLHGELGVKLDAMAAAPAGGGGGVDAEELAGVRSKIQELDAMLGDMRQSLDTLHSTLARESEKVAS